MDITEKRQCFLTIKDHKDDFRVNPKYRLLNPAKSELDKISKHILQESSANIRKALNANQWQNSSNGSRTSKTKTYILVFDKDSTHLSVRNFLKTQFNFHKFTQTSVRKNSHKHQSERY